MYLGHSLEDPAKIVGCCSLLFSMHLTCTVIGNGGTSIIHIVGHGVWQFFRSVYPARLTKLEVHAELQNYLHDNILHFGFVENSNLCT